MDGAYSCNLFGTFHRVFTKISVKCDETIAEYLHANITLMFLWCEVEILYLCVSPYARQKKVSAEFFGISFSIAFCWISSKHTARILSLFFLKIFYFSKYIDTKLFFGRTLNIFFYAIAVLTEIYVWIFGEAKNVNTVHKFGTIFKQIVNYRQFLFLKIQIRGNRNLLFFLCK